MILAAVTIKEVFGNGFLELATKGAENYAIAQTKEENMMKELNNYIKDKLNEVTDVKGSGNKAPRFIEGPKSVEEEKTNEKIKLVMTAEDEDGDNLIYIIKYWEVRRK